MRQFAAYLFVVTVLAQTSTACAPLTPAPIREKMDTLASIDQVRLNPEPYLQKRIKWGGNIIKVENLARESVMEVVGRKLDSTQRPLPEDFSSGRFLAVFSGFIDPAIYAPGREITLIGTIEKISSRNVGEFDYDFPQVRVETFYLWPEENPPRRGYYGPYWYAPYWYDPFWYDPWYYPYRHYPRRHPHR